MDDPAKAGLAEKNRNSRKLACRRFVVSPPHSPGDCIQAPFSIRVLRGYLPLQPRIALPLLNCKQFTLCGLGVLRAQILRVIGIHRQPLQGAWGQRCAGCIKGDVAEVRFAVTRCGMNSDSVGGGGMALEEEVEAFECACGAGFDFNRNDA